MKRNGCLQNLGQKLTWSEAQEEVAKLGAVPSQAVSPYSPLEDPHLCEKRAFGRSPKWTHSDWSDAQAWFHDNVAVYVLNLASQTERWLKVSKRLHDLDISATRVPGFDMRKLEDLKVAYREGAIPANYSVSQAQRQAALPGNNMNGLLGTLGCAAGHFRAQAMSFGMPRRQRKPLTLIFEDDAFPADDFVPRLWQLAREELPCDWEAVSLKSLCPFGRCVSRHLSRVQPDTNEPEWRCRHGVNYGMEAAAFRTDALPKLQQLWKSTVFNEMRPHCLDIDVALAAISDQVAFYAVPSAQDPGFLIDQLGSASVRNAINGEERSISASPDELQFK